MSGGGSQNHGDTWQPRSCPQSVSESRCLDLMLVRGVPGAQGTDNKHYGSELREDEQQEEEAPVPHLEDGTMA
jgi:hypothetical protein